MWLICVYGLMPTGTSDDELVARPQAGSKRATQTSSTTLHSLLDNVIDK